MTLVAKIDGVTLPDGALLIRGAPNSSLPGGIQGLPTAAWYGEAPQGGIQLDDPEGDLDSVLTIDGLHTFTVDETACTGKERIWSGWLTASGVSRGPYKDGPGRIWDVDIIDINWLFALEVFRASSAKRPAETDIVRAAWAMASAPMAGTPIHDNGRANFTDNPRGFGDSDYVTKYPIELFNSITATVGKQFYAYWDHDNDEISLHYDLIGVGPTSTLAISNVIADSDSTTFYPFLDADLRRDPAWRVTGILFGYRGAYAYGRRQATIDSLSPSEFSPNEFRRDEVYTTDRVGEAATANALIETMLEERALDIHTISVSIRVPNSQVNLIEAGDLIDVKFTHLPGYEDFVTLPVIRRNVVPTDGRTDMYDIHLELRSVAKAAGPGGGDPGEFPHQNICAASPPTIVQSKMDDAAGETTITFDSTPNAGNLLYLFTAFRQISVAGPIDGWTLSSLGTDTANNDDEQSVATYYRVSDGTETSVTTNWVPSSDHSRATFLEISGVGLPNELARDDSVNSLTAPGGTVAPAIGSTAIVVTGWGYNTGGDTNPWPNPDPVLSGGAGGLLFNKANGDHPVTGVGYQILTTATGSPIQHILTFSGFSPNGDESALAQTLVFVCEGGDCPDAGQWTPWVAVAEGDGVTTDFTLPCPYADLSLQVQVDGQPIILGLTESDPEAGEFSLDFAPLGAQGDAPAEQVWARYQGR